jgi:hypothetical protein
LLCFRGNADAGPAPPIILTTATQPAPQIPPPPAEPSQPTPLRAAAGLPLPPVKPLPLPEQPELTTFGEMTKSFDSLSHKFGRLHSALEQATHEQVIKNKLMEQKEIRLLARGKGKGKEKEDVDEEFDAQAYAPPTIGQPLHKGHSALFNCLPLLRSLDIVVHSEHGILLCLQCGFVIKPQEIKSHLSEPNRPDSPRHHHVRQKRTLSALITAALEQLSATYPNFKLNDNMPDPFVPASPTAVFPVVEGLQWKSGFRCKICSYSAGEDGTIRRHQCSINGQPPLAHQQFDICPVQRWSAGGNSTYWPIIEPRATPLTAAGPTIETHTLLQHILNDLELEAVEQERMLNLNMLRDSKFNVHAFYRSLPWSQILALKLRNRSLLNLP